MIIPCGAQHRQQLLDCLASEVEFNTFFISDIEQYGFDSDFQKIWMEQQGDTCTGIYLQFYSNLLVYSPVGRLNADFIRQRVKEEDIALVMGQSRLLQPEEWFAPGAFAASSNTLYTAPAVPSLALPPGFSAEVAAPPDANAIFDFIASIPEIRGLYPSRQMIYDRIATGGGTHLMVRHEGRIIAHANSAGANSRTAMIGGVATAPQYRGRGLAGALVSRLAGEILAAGRRPCLFAQPQPQPGLFEKLGFIPLGGWTTLKRCEGQQNAVK